MPYVKSLKATGCKSSPFLQPFIPPYNPLAQSFIFCSDFAVSLRLRISMFLLTVAFGSAAEMAMNRIIPPKRTMFQERDEIWENYKKALDARLEAGRRRRAMGLRRSLRENLDGKTDESKGDAGEDGHEEENGGV